MKKSLLILAAFAAAALFSCTEIIVEQPVVDPDGTTVLTPGEGGTHFSFSVIREDPATKSYLSGTDFLWEDGEEISVCYGGSNVKFTYDEATGKFNSDAFDPEAAGPFYVVAPYNAGITIDGSGKIHTELPANQVDKGKGLDPAALLSVGKAADVAALTAGISLKNAFSLVKVAVSDSDVDRISIDGNYSGTGISPLLAGAVTVDPSDGSVVATGRGTSVSLTSAGGNFAAGAYILAVLPQTMTNGIKMVFRRAGEAQSYYRNSSKSISFVRNAGISFAAVSVAGLTKRCYYVNDAADLVAWGGAGTFNGTDNIFLGADIDMDGESWTPVDGFAGTFDGQNHRIYNLSVSGNTYVGFISLNKDDSSTAVLKNVVFGSFDGENWDGVSNFTHSASPDIYTWYYVGVFAKAWQNAAMSNVTNYSKIEVAAGSTGKTRIAGLCGNWASTGSMINCTNYGTIVNSASISGKDPDNDKYQDSVIGGVVAQCDAAGTIENCDNHGIISTVNTYVGWVGGILGCTGAAMTLNNCKNYANISTNGYYDGWAGIGGVCGDISGGATISDCQCIDATISDMSNVCAGVVANMKLCTITGCKISGVTVIASGKQYVAGIVARANGGTISDCQVLSGCSITGANYTAGLCANSWTSAVINDCTVTGATISGGAYVAGGVAWLEGGSSQKNTVVSSCTITGSGINVGGIAGLFDASSVTGCQVISGTTVTGNEEVGGICGQQVNAGTFTNCSFINSSVTSATDDVGGIIGWTKGGGNLTVTGCSVSGSTVKATTKNRVGGIIGLKQNAGTVTVSDCTVSSSSIIGVTNRVAGIIADANSKADVTINHCFVKNGCLIKGKHSIGGMIGWISLTAGNKLVITNCGLEASTLEATASDGTPPGGDSMVAGMVGWLSVATSGVVARIINCYSYPGVGGIKVDVDMTMPDVGGLLGFVSPNSTGELLLANCATNLKRSDIIINDAVVPDISAGKRVGAVFGCLYNDYATTAIDRNYYISDEGLLIGDSKDGAALANAVLSGNESFTEAVFTDGSTVPAKLNAYVSGFSGSETLKTWTVNGAGLPVLND